MCCAKKKKRLLLYLYADIFLLLRLNLLACSLILLGEKMAANICTCICKHTDTAQTHTLTILVARAGLEYSAAVTHEEKFLIINIQPIMNVLLAAVVLGA